MGRMIPNQHLQSNPSEQEEMESNREIDQKDVFLFLVCRFPSLPALNQLNVGFDDFQEVGGEFFEAVGFVFDFFHEGFAGFVGEGGFHI